MGLRTFYKEMRENEAAGHQPLGLVGVTTNWHQYPYLKTGTGMQLVLEIREDVSS